MVPEQENELEAFHQGIDNEGNKVPGPRGMLFSALDNLERIENELDKKDRTSKKEVRLLLKDVRRQVFEALKGIKGV